MFFPELATSIADQITAAFKTANIAVTPATTAYLTTIGSRTRCWKGIFEATATWLAQASAQEQAVTWQVIVANCDRDERPLAALPRLSYFKSNAQALKTLWLALPPDALPILKVTLAANPLLYAMFSDPASGVTGLPAELDTPAKASAMWTKIQHRMDKLSRYDNPAAT